MDALAALVGRDAEREVLADLVRRVPTHGLQVVGLSGPAGIGKSALAEHCLAAAGSAGFRSLTGGCAPLYRDLAYAPLVEALRSLARPEFTRGLPDLGRLFGEMSLPPAPALGEAALERTRLFESVRLLVARASARRPLALLVDDVHWADRGSLELLQYLVRGLTDRPVLVVLGYREDEIDAALGELLDALGRARLLTELRLRGLVAPAVRAMADGLLSGRAPDDLVEMLLVRSGGVPLFVRALVGALVDGDGLYRHDGRWLLAARPPAEVPPAVTALLRSRIERLPAAARAVLELVAVCGGQAEHALVERLLPDDRLLSGLAALRVGGVVAEEVVDGRVRYRVAHPLLAEVAYELLTLVARRRRHAEVARAVREYAPERHGLLGLHVRRAGDEFDRDEALRVLVAAADDALARKAGQEALADLRAAHELAEALDRHELRPGLLDRIGEAHDLAGDRERAVAAWLDAAARHPPGVDRAERMRRAAWLEWDAGRYAQSRHCIDAAAAELAGIEPASVHVNVAVAGTLLAYRADDVDDLLARLPELGRLAERLDSVEARAAVAMARCHVALVDGRHVEARTHLAALLDLAARLGDGHGERARRLGFCIELGWGDLRSARACAEDALKLGRRTGVPSLERSPRANLGLAAFFSGDWNEGLRRAAEVVDLGERIGLPRATALGSAVRGLVMVRSGRFADARDCARRARERLGEQAGADRHLLSLIEPVEASVALAVGDATRAAAIAAASARRNVVLPGLTSAVLAEAQLALGDANGASATADRLAAIGPHAPYPAALAAWIRGRVASDPALLHRAAEELAALGFGYEAAVSRLDLADLCPDEAGELAGCLGLLDRLGAAPAADRARKLLRRNGHRAPTPARHRRTGGLTAREEQVVRLVAEGLSNPEIAARLYLSTRTVTTHLQNVYRRLGLASRAALISYVLRDLPSPGPGEDT